MRKTGFWRLAEENPEWVAAVDPDGTHHTAAEVLARANQIVHALRDRGVGHGDCVATLLPNGVAPLEFYVAALQAGWYFTPINWHLAVPEITHILRDCQAKAFIASERYADVAVAVADDAGLSPRQRISYGTVPTFERVDSLREGEPTVPPADRTAGRPLFYSSGTTGRPKAIRRKLPEKMDPDEGVAGVALMHELLGVSLGQPNTHLVTSPNYHTAVTQFAAIALHAGHTLVYMDSFEAEDFLRLVEKHRVTSTHVVPTHFKRLLSLPSTLRKKYDTSSMKWLIHGAAPCPVQLKREMLEWWGECIYEYYSATEGGGTFVTPQEWLEHPGTVGRPWPVTEFQVVDDEGAACPPGVPGNIYMRMVTKFERKDEPATNSPAMADGFFNVGDIGYFDADGFLYLCDRKSEIINSGGVNIYPAEVESELILHPKVADVAVFGVPDNEWGEQVKAVVELEAGVEATPALGEEIRAWLDGRLARMEWPRSVDFAARLPRDASGKLLRRKLRDPYWAGRDRVI